MKSKRADAVIIGGGIHGCATAYLMGILVEGGDENE